MKYLGVPQSGSQAGTTASHNRAGQYFRSRRAPVSPTRTPKQGQARANFGSASALWQSMTAALQNAWTAFAMQYPVVDALGQSVVLTGQQYFVGINAQLAACGQLQSTAIPNNTTLPAIVNPTIQLDGSGTFIVGVGTVLPGDFNKVSCSPVLSNGVNFNKQFSLFALLNDGNETLDISVAYAAQYGAPVTGKKIFCNFVEVNSSGMSSNGTIIQTPVAPAPVAAAPVLTQVLTATLIATGPGVGTENVMIFEETTMAGVFMPNNTVNQVAGIATFAGVDLGKRFYVRTLIAGVYGPASNILTSF